ncbi:hypothetical protein ACO9S2_17030 [Nitrospira sp. NS4]|uniref:hypothetical protein n=1 Tax=Nitrospira sp. NS4 TaxID=3414498 RepID=UPI003C2B0B7C
MITTSSGGTDGREAEHHSEEARKEISGWEKEAVTVRVGAEHMSQHADMVALYYPRGVTAFVWFDLATGAIATTHAGLRELLRRGISGWEGQVVYPHDGPIFLSAVYDHFFMSGYGVQWLSLSGLKEVRNAYRV